MSRGDDLATRYRQIYDLDLSRLADMDRLGALSHDVCAALTVLFAAAERDARIKLRRVRLDRGGVTAWAVAWVVTRPLRLATGAMRQASAESVAYRIRLRAEFAGPTPGKPVRRNRRTHDGDFDILGGRP